MKTEPRPIIDPHIQRKPIRYVHEIFILDHTTGDLGSQTIVTTG
jgi:hypothetical protein